ncbi:MAG: DUF4240 domain-containing protein [Saprospiraceae bacterium]|nr:DUF4240 domain-containing protein [Saprospiraceae bacterium]
MMNEEGFWGIIGQLDWSKEANDDILAPAARALSLCDEADIRQFSEILAKKLYDLDGERFAKEMAADEIKWVDGELRFSVDLFLYARCVVVANGREFYEAVLNDPTLMPKGYGFESLLYLDNKAWELKTGQEDYIQYTEYWYETFSNPDGWPGIIPLKDRILGKNG